MSYHFFTEENSITNVQQADMSFGAISDLGSKERYNLENKFSVSANAKVYAIAKSLLLALPDENNSNLLNIALLPIEDNYLAGFPIKFIIYRGVSKASLIDGTDKILQEDNTWDAKNILKIIKDLQDEINQDNGTNDEANATSLGLQYSTAPNDTYLESLFFDETDDFHPLIVPKGCQIGKFSGGTDLAGIELILDKIGSETTTGILKATSHLFQIDKLVLASGLSEKEKQKLRFINRIQKEEVLAYMDVTAFYGSCKNQSIRISGVSNNTDYFNKFHNRNSVYIDVRDERGFSFNHFLKLEDEVNIGFYDGQNNDPVYAVSNYYQDWPILKLDNKSYSSSKDYFYLKLPILIGMPEVANILTSFTKKVSVGKSKRNLRYKLLNQLEKDGTISLKESEPIRLKNWEFSDDTLGANYFLLKLDKISGTDRSQILAPIWNSFFSLKMRHIFKLDNIQDGEFRVKTYSSLNAPLLTNNSANEIFYPTIGIAADKYHITFFSFYREAAHKTFRRKQNYPVKAIDTGRFNYNFDTENLNYQNQDQAVGFLYQITNNNTANEYELSQYSLTDVENQITDLNFLKYLKSGDTNNSDEFFENFEAITLTHAEYNYLKSLESSVITNQDYIAEHPLFIRSKAGKINSYERFSLVEFPISLGIAKIIGETTYEFDLEEYPNSIELNNEEISITSVTTH